MTAQGRPIQDYSFRPAAATITYTLAYEEEQARIAAGMSITDYDALPGSPMWINPETGGRSKCHIILLYRMAQYIPAVANDAQARKAEQDMRRHRPR